MTVTRIATACLAAATLTACETKPTEWFRVEPLSVRQADLDAGDKDKQVARTEGAPASVNLDVFELELPPLAPTQQSTQGSGQTQTSTRNAAASPSADAPAKPPVRKVRLTQVSQPDERDAWIAFLIERSTQQCDYHKAGIVATQSIVNGTMGATAGVLGGVGALVTGATAARIFSGSAGMVTGLRAQYNEVFYQNLISTAVVRKIDEMRNTKYASIKAQLGKPMAEYSIHRAMLDIGEYHNACSFYAGLVALTDEKQRLKPLGDSLQLQITATKASIASLKADLDATETKLGSATNTEIKTLHTDRIRELRQSLRDQDMHLRSLQNQLSIVGASTGKPEDGKEPDAPPANGADGANPGDGTPKAAPQTPVQQAPIKR